MRIALAIPLLLLGACQVSKDDANDSVTVAYNQDLAENTAADVGNTVEAIAGDIGNDVGREVDRAKNTDIDIDVDRNGDANTANKQ